QWFCDLSRNNLKSKAIEAIHTINMIPQGSHNRFEATVGGRLEWCLSRQRTWGVPIPAFICTICDYTYSTTKLFDTVVEHVKKQGIEYWETVTPESLGIEGIVCKDCNGTSFTKE